MIARILSKFTEWALARNAPGSYAGEDDKRWAYTISTNGSPYLTRVMAPRITLPLVGSFRVMLHYFHRPDVDAHPHSHPWKWAASLVLSGAYEETRVVDGELAWNNFRGEWMKPTVTRLVSRFNKLTARDYHKVDKLHGEVWTLFVTGDRSPDDNWGFLVEDRHVPWRKYLGKDEPRNTAFIDG